MKYGKYLWSGTFIHCLWSLASWEHSFTSFSNMNTSCRLWQVCQPNWHYNLNGRMWELLHPVYCPHGRKWAICYSRIWKLWLYHHLDSQLTPWPKIIALLGCLHTSLQVATLWYHDVSVVFVAAIHSRVNMNLNPVASSKVYIWAFELNCKQFATAITRRMRSMACFWWYNSNDLWKILHLETILVCYWNMWTPRKCAHSSMT